MTNSVKNALQLAWEFTKTAYTQGYDGKKFVPDKSAPESLRFYLEYQHKLGALHASRDKQSEYWTPYGIGRHG